MFLNSETKPEKKKKKKTPHTLGANKQKLLLNSLTCFAFWLSKKENNKL